MAETHRLLPLLFFFITISTINTVPCFSTPIKALVAPITKDVATSTYTITLSKRQYLLDLTAISLSSLCAKHYQTIPCKSPTCSAAHVARAGYCSPDPTSGVGACQRPNNCAATIANPIAGSCSFSVLSLASIMLSTTNGHNPISPVTIRRFVTFCSVLNTTFVSLPKSAVGIAGLARSPLALPLQLSSVLSIKKQFAICLPSFSPGSGVTFFGDGPFYLLPPPGLEVNSLLSFTALLKNPILNKVGHYIGLKGIAINQGAVKLPAHVFEFDSIGNGGVQLSTATPYTTMRTDIYKPFLEAYSNSLAKVPRANKVAPFDLCFNSTFLGSTRVGFGVPPIDLMLAEGKNWTIFGANSLTQVTPDTACLAFVDGGDMVIWGTSVTVVIGAVQMENNFLLFDLEKSMLGFSSSLLGIRTTCSNFNFTAGV